MMRRFCRRPTAAWRSSSRTSGRQGRVYLPHDELARFGVAPIDWLGPVGTDNLRQLLTFQCQRAAGLFEAGARTERFLDQGAKRVFHLMWTTYRTLLARIERDPLVVLRRRVRLSRLDKLLLAGRAMAVK
jgi:phytoene synthase